MSPKTKQSGTRKKKILGGLALLATTFAINLFVHFGGAVRAGVKAADFPSLPITSEVQALMIYQGKCLNECSSYWMFVPGSFMWRSHKFPEVGHHSKYFQFNKSSQEKRRPKEYNPPKIFKI